MCILFEARERKGSGNEHKSQKKFLIHSNLFLHLSHLKGKIKKVFFLVPNLQPLREGHPLRHFLYSSSKLLVSDLLLSLGFPFLSLLFMITLWRASLIKSGASVSSPSSLVRFRDFESSIPMRLHPRWFRSFLQIGRIPVIGDGGFGDNHAGAGAFLPRYYSHSLIRFFKSPNCHCSMPFTSVS